MAQYGPTSVPFFFVGGRDLLASVLHDFDESKEGILVESHGLGPAFSWKESKGIGVGMANLSQRGFFDDAANGVNDALNGQQATAQIVGYGLSGNAIGKKFVGLEGAFGGKYVRSLSRQNLHMASAEYSVKGQRDEGVIVLPKSTVVAAGNNEGATNDRLNDVDIVAIPITSSSVANPTTITTTVPHGLTSGDKVYVENHAGSTPAIAGEYTATVTGASTFTIPVNVTVGGTGGSVKRVMSTNGGVGYLFVPAVTLGGYTSWTVKIRHSADGATFVDLITFTIITVAPVAVRAVVAGTVNRYLAASWSLQGAGAAPSLSAAVGFARG